MTMNEKLYKTMSSTGACSLAVGIIILATGITAGIMMIINGASASPIRSRLRGNLWNLLSRIAIVV